MSALELMIPKASVAREARRFTLIELMVVVAIVILLAGFLMPVLTKAKGRAVETKIMNNMRQIHLANIQYKTSNDEKYMVNTWDGNTVGVNWDPLREHGFTDELSEDLFRLTTLQQDIELEGMALPVDLSDFHATGRGILYFNIETYSPCLSAIDRTVLNNEFQYFLPEDTQVVMISVGINGVIDTGKPRNDFVFLSRESNANVEQWPGGR